MAIIELCAVFAILICMPVWGLIVVILFALALRQISRRLRQFFRRQVQLKSNQNVPPVTGKSHQSSEPAPTTPAFTRPPLHRRNCFFLDPDGFILEPLPPSLDFDSSSTSGSEGYETAREDWEVDSFSTPDSEGYETAPKDFAPAKAMSETRALEAFDEDRHESTLDLSDTSNCNGEDAESIKHRNIKMREEGIRLNVNYSQMASLKPAPVAAGALRGGASRTTSPPSSSSPPSSLPSTMSPPSGLRSPAPTPCGGVTDITTTGTHRGVASVLPTMGPAAGQDMLYRIDEKLLAIPADAVSRRLLRDGRYILRHGKRLPRSVASVEVAPSPVTAEGGLQTSESDVYYPSEMME